MWDFAAGCMRDLPRAGRARRSTSTRCPRSRGAGGRLGVPELGEPSVDGDDADALKAEADGLDALAARGYGNERLDQLAVEVLLGVR